MRNRARTRLNTINIRKANRSEFVDAPAPGNKNLALTGLVKPFSFDKRAKSKSRPLRQTV